MVSSNWRVKQSGARTTQHTPCVAGLFPWPPSRTRAGPRIGGTDQDTSRRSTQRPRRADHVGAGGGLRSGSGSARSSKRSGRAKGRRPRVRRTGRIDAGHEVSGGVPTGKPGAGDCRHARECRQSTCTHIESARLQQLALPMARSRLERSSFCLAVGRQGSPGAAARELGGQRHHGAGDGWTRWNSTWARGCRPLAPRLRAHRGRRGGAGSGAAHGRPGR